MGCFEGSDPEATVGGMLLLRDLTRFGFALVVDRWWNIAEATSLSREELNSLCSGHRLDLERMT